MRLKTDLVEYLLTQTPHYILLPACFKQFKLKFTSVFVSALFVSMFTCLPTISHFCITITYLSVCSCSVHSYSVCLTVRRLSCCHNLHVILTKRHALYKCIQLLLVNKKQQILSPLAVLVICTYIHHNTVCHSVPTSAAEAPPQFLYTSCLSRPVS